MQNIGNRINEYSIVVRIVCRASLSIFANRILYSHCRIAFLLLLLLFSGVECDAVQEHEQRLLRSRTERNSLNKFNHSTLCIKSDMNISENSVIRMWNEKQKYHYCFVYSANFIFIQRLQFVFMLSFLRLREWERERSTHRCDKWNKHARVYA